MGASSKDEKQLKYYAGIGSRQTPDEIQKVMSDLATYLEKRNYVLRSGGAKGADTAFERRVGRKEIFRPFHAKDAINNPEHWANQAASRACLEWPLHKMEPYVQGLIVRNMFQIHGLSGRDTVEFVVCWVPTQDPCNKDAGGTRYACREAAFHKVPILNLNVPETLAKVKEKIYSQ